MALEEAKTYEEIEKWVQLDDHFHNVTCIFYHSDLCKFK
jgi:hypothetical protein